MLGKLWGQDAGEDVGDGDGVESIDHALYGVAEEVGEGWLETTADGTLAARLFGISAEDAVVPNGKIDIFQRDLVWCAAKGCPPFRAGLRLNESGRPQLTNDLPDCDGIDPNTKAYKVGG